MSQYLQNKKGLVQNAFNKVYDKYDLMNDFMSIGIHRLWKKDMINWMAPLPKKKLIDMACGTGDLGKLFLESTNYAGKVLFVDPNSKMLKKGIERLKKHKNISWKKGGAEKIPTPDNNFDYYCISFGLRNTKNINKSLKEAYRVLKPGGTAIITFFLLDELYQKSLSIRSEGIGKYHMTSKKRWIFDKRVYGSKDWFCTNWAKVPENAIGVTDVGLNRILSQTDLKLIKHYQGNWKEVLGVFWQDVLVLKKA